MSKSTKATTATPTLTELKLAVVNFHSGEYTRISVARDACYTSHNSIQWKLGQMSDLKAEIASLMPLDDQSEVVSVKLAKKLDIFHSMEDELAELEERHNADLEVYKLTSGDDWMRTPRSTGKAESSSILEEAQKILAS